MMEIVKHFSAGTEFVPVVGSQSSQRKPLKIGAAGKKDDEKNGKQENRHRRAEHHRKRRPRVEFRAVFNRFFNAERDGNQINDEGRPQSERNRNRHPFGNQFQYAFVLIIAAAEVETDIVFDHFPQTFVNRLVKTELLFQFLHQFFGHAPGAAVSAFAAAHPHFGAGSDLRGGVDVHPPVFGQRMFDRAAGRQLNNREIDQQNAEKRQRDEEQPFDDVIAHYSFSFIHQV